MLSTRARLWETSQEKIAWLFQQIYYKGVAKGTEQNLPVERDLNNTSLLQGMDLVWISIQTNGYYTYTFCICTKKCHLSTCQGTMQGTTYKDKERGDVGILCWGHHHLPRLPHRWGLLWRPETATPILRAGSSSQPGPGPPHPGTQWRNGKSALFRCPRAEGHTCDCT